MSFRIEVSFDIRKTKNVTEMKELIKKLSIKNSAEMCFFDHEIMGHGRTINRNHAIAIAYFPEQKKLINFIKTIKKIKQIYIESIGMDDGLFILIYASKKYLNFMDKFKVKEYLNDKKKILKGQYASIIDIITKKV